MITDIGDFFRLGCGRCPRFATPECSVRPWEAGLAALRRLCLDAGLEEVVKWGHPCYMHKGRNIAIIGALRGDFRLSFFNAALMKDPDGVLERQGPNTQHPDMIRFTAHDQVTARAATITGYLHEAMGYAEAGILSPRRPRAVDLPEELIEALDADPELAEAFHALTPGRQKSYAFNLNTAKTVATRIARIEKFRPKIMAGKGALDR
ncbi:YdeI/OmpD-associated family protein [Pseudogemmobacter bohemicus]|uniref:YdeI/OmpD-associated family protein n=1 Tax=Pseudogemmobacter bohemicus TaxID=2250708 RepID=UPI000DD4B0B1|nr:YdeI/OmpD-associated family protein [Pseudogemmobacter bohemicus]